MKKTISILAVTLAALAALVPGGAQAVEPAASYTVVLAGGSAENTIRISLSSDGRNYVITSAVPLEVGGSVCENAPGSSTELICRAPMVAGFEVNGGSGDDTVSVTREVLVPVTLHGGSGDDVLVGGGGPDKIVGGQGDDRLLGRGGDDLIYGGPGDDTIVGGPGDDALRGGPGRDLIYGGSGENDIRQEMGP
jgi:Ca2+-binding RTX toxin-like protein